MHFFNRSQRGTNYEGSDHRSIPKIEQGSSSWVHLSQKTGCEEMNLPREQSSLGLGSHFCCCVGHFDMWNLQ